MQIETLHSLLEFSSGNVRKICFSFMGRSEERRGSLETMKRAHLVNHKNFVAGMT